MNVGIVPRLRMPKLGIAPHVIAVLLVFGLLCAMAIEPTRQLLEQRDRISGMAAELEAVQEGNERLEAQLARLMNDDYIEQRARAQIGLVRPGETTYVVMPPGKGDERPRKRVVKVQPPPPPSFVESVLHFIGL